MEMSPTSVQTVNTEQRTSFNRNNCEFKTTFANWLAWINNQAVACYEPLGLYLICINTFILYNDNISGQCNNIGFSGYVCSLAQQYCI